MSMDPEIARAMKAGISRAESLEDTIVDESAAAAAEQDD